MLKVIAIGNRLMKDDGIAIAVLEILRNKLELMGIDVIMGETDFQFCFHILKEHDFVIFLDAAFTGAEAGTVNSQKLHEVAAVNADTNSSHDMSIFDLMRLHSNLPDGYLISIEIAEVDFGYELSNVLKRKFSDICLRVERAIYEIVKEVKNARYLSK